MSSTRCTLVLVGALGSGFINKCNKGGPWLQVVYSWFIGGKTSGNQIPTMTRQSTTANMTAAELAAWKASNLAQPSKVVILEPVVKSARKSQRQEWQEFRNETLGMIEAAKRECHFHILPQLFQRLNTANDMLANRAIA